jgi:hypothetical protein
VLVLLPGFSFRLSSSSSAGSGAAQAVTAVERIANETHCQILLIVFSLV